MPRVAVQNGACHREPARDAPASSHAVTFGRFDQSSTSGCAEDSDHLRLRALGSVIAMPSTCGIEPKAPRMKVFSACSSSSFTVPRSICSTAHCACRTTG